MAQGYIKVGIIGGSGLNNPTIFTDSVEVDAPLTAFGRPSELRLLEGKIEGVPCILLPRHGKKHTIMPSQVNYRANLLALKKLGCTHVLVSTACGSLKKEIAPGDFVVLDQFIDRTTKRSQTFYDGTSEEFKGVMHIPMGSPFCNRMRLILTNACNSLGFKVHSKGTMVTIEGPRFSSKAESNLFRSWNADVINMTTVPEVILARELGLSYGSLAMATDYDCWTEEEVNVENVLAVMKQNAERGIEVFKRVISEIGKQNWQDTLADLEANVKQNVILLP